MLTTLIGETGTVGLGLGLKLAIASCSKTISILNYYLSTPETQIDFKEIINICVGEDLERKVGKISLLMKELEEVENLNLSVISAIEDINRAVIDINSILQQCKIIKQEYDSLYWKTWRKIDYTPTLAKLQLGIKILNIRFCDLDRIVSISSHIYKCKKSTTYVETLPTLNKLLENT